MTRTMTILCAAASAAASATVSALVLYAGPAGAAPLSTPLAATSADIQSTEAVQYRRRHHSRWDGPRAYAYYGSGYNSYARAPGYGGFTRGGHTCSRDKEEEYSAYPSWWCSRIRNYQ
jgi:hypothetical protein